MLTPANPQLTRDHEIFSNMIDLLDNEGWIQGALHNDEGRCLLGLLDECTKTDQEVRRGHTRLQNFIGQSHSVAGWNDNKWRTKEQVRNLLFSIRAQIIKELTNVTHDSREYESYSDQSDFSNTTIGAIFAGKPSVDNQDERPEGSHSSPGLLSLVDA